MDLLIDATTNFLRDGTIQANKMLGDRFDNVQIFYSTPERYTKCKYVDLLNSKRGQSAQRQGDQTERTRSNDDASILTQLASNNKSSKPHIESMQSKFDPPWKVKRGDFFPYADCDHCYWTGYFTSRQGLKRIERVGSSFLHASRQIDSMLKLQETMPVDEHQEMTYSRTGSTTDKTETSSSWTETFPSVKSWNTSPLYTLDDAMGVAQHHDAVSGTSKQHVAYDYAKRIAGGIKDASAYVTNALRKLLLDSSAVLAGAIQDISYCHLLNETVCDISQVCVTPCINGVSSLFCIKEAPHSRRTYLDFLFLNIFLEHSGSISK